MAISNHIAVMNEGKIIQIGTAEELYLRPESPFVAQFIGKINLLPAEVKGVTEEKVMLRIFRQNYQVSKGPSRFEPGERVNVLVRPETIELVETIDEDSLKASVVERSFLGEKVDYHLDLDGHPIYATSYDPLRHGTFSLHQEVGVRFNPDAITILKEMEK